MRYFGIFLGVMAAIGLMGYIAYKVFGEIVGSSLAGGMGAQSSPNTSYISVSVPTNISNTPNNSVTATTSGGSSSAQGGSGSGGGSQGNGGLLGALGL